MRTIKEVETQTDFSLMMVYGKWTGTIRKSANIGEVGGEGRLTRFH